MKGCENKSAPNLKRLEPSLVARRPLRVSNNTSLPSWRDAPKIPSPLRYRLRDGPLHRGSDYLERL